MYKTQDIYIYDNYENGISDGKQSMEACRTIGRAPSFQTNLSRSFAGPSRIHSNSPPSAIDLLPVLYPGKRGKICYCKEF